jgi:hypothetical protein
LCCKGSCEFVESSPPTAKNPPLKKSFFPESETRISIDYAQIHARISIDYAQIHANNWF